MSILAGTISRVRDLHSRTQKGWLWEIQFSPLRFDPPWVLLALKDLKFLATSVSFPGFEVESKPFFIGGNERYVAGKIKRGGVVTVSFLELEGRMVDRFFRSWLNLKVDFPLRLLGAGLIRLPRNSYARTAFVSFRNRSGVLSSVYKLSGLIPQSLGGYELSYDASNSLVLTARMSCDFVEAV